MSAPGSATSADVPGRYDIELASFGYVFADTVEPSLPFRTHRAIYDISPTFVERQNVSNQYGDNAQDFFLTVRQRDWSLGEQQKFFRQNNDGRYWVGSNVDVSVPGQVMLAPGVNASLSGIVSGSRRAASATNIVVADTTTGLYTVDPTGTTSLIGDHGLGVAAANFGVCTDGLNNYISNHISGVGVRKYNGSTFSTFSTTPSDVLCYLNNTLFGLRSDTQVLQQYDTSGAASTIYTWKAADGTASGGWPQNLADFGGQLLILFQYGQGSDCGAELWVYDGTGVRRIAVMPPNFVGWDIEVLYGVAYISGSFTKAASASTYYTRPAVLFYDSSQIGLLWQANSYLPTAVSSPTTDQVPALGIFDGKLIFNDDTNGSLLAYNPVAGGVSTIQSGLSTSNSSPRIVTSGTNIAYIRHGGTGYVFPNGRASSGYVTSSLVDFDSSLTKSFRGIKVEWQAASDGDGGSVDIAYQVDSLDGSWTTLKTGAASGTEYTLSGVSGRAIAVKVTLNKGTSTNGPVLKSLNVRAAPTLMQFRSGLYILDCTGSPDAPRELRDGSYHPLSGHDQVQNLFALAQSTAPFSVTDRFGTFTALVDLNDPEGFDVYEVHPNEDNPKKSGSYFVRLKVREV